MTPSTSHGKSPTRDMLSQSDIDRRLKKIVLSDIHRQGKLILLAIAALSPNGESVVVSTPKLGSVAGLHTRSVQRHFIRLEERGLIARHPHVAQDGRYVLNELRILWDAVA